MNYWFIARTEFATISSDIQYRRLHEEERSKENNDIDFWN